MWLVLGPPLPVWFFTHSPHSCWACCGRIHSVLVWPLITGTEPADLFCTPAFTYRADWTVFVELQTWSLKLKENTQGKMMEGVAGTKKLENWAKEKVKAEWDSPEEAAKPGDRTCQFFWRMILCLFLYGFSFSIISHKRLMEYCCKCVDGMDAQVCECDDFKTRRGMSLTLIA